LEILENVTPDAEVLRACRKLRSQGYSLAMDDFIRDHSESPLLDLVKYVKVDLLATSHDEQRDIARELSRHGITLDIPTTARTHLRLLQVSQSPDLDLRGLEKLVRPEVALCYRLLRYLNSAAFGLYPIRSVRHALTLLGEREVRKWIALVTTAMLAQDKPTELVRMAMVRGHFCEAFAEGSAEEDFFLAGLFSLLDAMLDRPMDHLVHDLPISERCRIALLGGENEIAEAIRRCELCERGTCDPEDNDSSDTAWIRFQQATAWTYAVLGAST
jgi:EAL and modified HD-GYP domain-containing signal transduction protein